MTIRVKCDSCGSVLKIKDRLAGTEGKCPKCKSSFKIPEPGNQESPSGEKSAGAGAEEELSEEDAIFGKDFFNLQEKPSGPRFTAPVFEEEHVIEDDSEDEPAPKAPSKPFASARPTSADNSSNIAGQLLSKTGKKNRPDDWQDPEDEEGGYDFSAINYLVMYRILPGTATAIILTYVFYTIFSGMFGDVEELPPLSKVTGLVTLDDKPVAAQLSFRPESGPREKAIGAGSIGRAGADGRYVLKYKAGVEGALVGKHKVEIAVDNLRFSRNADVGQEETEINFDLKTPPPTGPPGR